MEKQIEKNEVLTKEIEPKKTGVFLSLKDAEEYRTYKRRKQINEIAAAIAVSECSLLGGEDVQRTCEKAIRLKQAAVKVPLTKLSQAAYYLSGSGVRLDCVVGGTGETLAKVKAYEAKLARRRGAAEITLSVTPSLVDSCRYGEIRRELKRVMRAAGKACVKVRVENRLTPTAFARLARLACDAGARYFSVPYFKGCERIRQDLTGGCRLEVSGVETLEEYQKLREAGTSRIVTDRGWELYTEWIKVTNEEGDFTPVQPLPSAPVASVAPVENGAKTEEKKTETAERTEKVEKVLSTLPAAAITNPETDYCCRLEGTELKFT